jgi:hypothetical protein
MPVSKSALLGLINEIVDKFDDIIAQNDSKSADINYKYAQDALMEIAGMIQEGIVNE